MTNTLAEALFTLRDLVTKSIVTNTLTEALLTLRELVAENIVLNTLPRGPRASRSPKRTRLGRKPALKSGTAKSIVLEYELQVRAPPRRTKRVAEFVI